MWPDGAETSTQRARNPVGRRIGTAPDPASLMRLLLGANHNRGRVRFTFATRPGRSCDVHRAAFARAIRAAPPLARLAFRPGLSAKYSQAEARSRRSLSARLALRSLRPDRSRRSDVTLWAGRSCCTRRSLSARIALRSWRPDPVAGPDLGL